jgi:hypothetical protein
MYNRLYVNAPPKPLGLGVGGEDGGRGGYVIDSRLLTSRNGQFDIWAHCVKANNNKNIIVFNINEEKSCTVR